MYFIQENKGNSRPLLEEFARAELALRQRKLTESLNHFKDLENKSKDAPLYDDVLMKIGEIQLKLGNSLDAITAFSFIADSLEQSRIEYSKLLYFAPEYLMKSRFRLAELDYFETHFDSALSKLQQITVETNQELTNDAL